MSLLSGFELMMINSSSALESLVPINQTEYVAFIAILLPVSVLGLIGWSIIFAVIFRERLYDDPDNLILLSFGLADFLILCYCLVDCLQLLLFGRFAAGYMGCIAETFIVTIGFCSSGMHVVIMSLDRYLLMCHGFHKSWSKTMMLLCLCWGVSLIFPCLATFTNIPHFAALIDGLYCVPNFASRESGTRGWLIFALVLIYLAFATIIYCYSAVYIKYTQLKMKSFAKQNQVSSNDNVKQLKQQTIQPLQLPPELSSLALKLLFKFITICAFFLACFLPLTTGCIYMTVYYTLPNQWVFFTVVKIFECSPLVNAFLLYHLDAKMKRSVNEMVFGKDYSTSRSPSSIFSTPRAHRSEGPRREIVLRETIAPSDLKTVLINAGSTLKTRNMN